MTDLYSVLGVAKAATKAQIRAAYRKKAKAAHPDVGGDADAFTLLKLAHDVLTDEMRRKRYDTTGSTETVAEHNEMAEVYQIAVQVMCAVCSKVDDPASKNIVKMMLAHIDDAIGQTVAQDKQINEMLKRLTTASKRLRAPAGVEHDPFRAALESQISRFSASSAASSKSRDALVKTRTFIEAYGYDFVEATSLWEGSLEREMMRAIQENFVTRRVFIPQKR